MKHSCKGQRLSLRNKYLSLIISMLLFLSANAQDNLTGVPANSDSTRKYQDIKGDGFNWKGGRFVDVLRAPHGLSNVARKDSGAIGWYHNRFWQFTNEGIWDTLSGGSGSGGGSGIIDTVFLADDLIDRPRTASGKQVIGRLHSDGLVSGGVVTGAGGMDIQITSALYYLNNGKQYIAPSTVITIPGADATYHTKYTIVVDTLGQVHALPGSPAPDAIAPQANPASQWALTVIDVEPGATSLSINSIVIYDETGGTEYTPSTSGTITANASNTDNPKHLTKADYISSYHDGSKRIFTKSSGQDTVFDNSLFKWFHWFNNLFHNNLQMQLFLGSTAVSSNIVVNSYLNILDTLEYQVVAIPRYVFGGAGNIIFDKIVYTMAGNDTSGVGGFYIDWLQLQTGVSNGSGTIFVPQTLQQVFNTEIGGSVLTKIDTIKITDDKFLMLLGSLGRYTITNSGIDFLISDGGGNSSEFTSGPGNQTLSVANSDGLGSTVDVVPERVRIHSQSTTPESNIDTYADSVIISNVPFITASTTLGIHGDRHSIEAIGDSLVFDFTTYTFKHIPIVSGIADSGFVRDPYGHLAYKKLPSGGGGGIALDTLYRTPGKDSAQFTINGRYHAIKDSVGLTSVDTTNISNFSVKVRSLFSASAPITFVNGLIAADTSKAHGKLATFDDVGGKVDSITKAPTRDSFYVWKAGTHIALKDSTGGTSSTTVTEQKNYYNGEFYWNHGINTSTGAFTSNTAIDISDYLPIEGSTSVTISTVDSSLITIYGWTYDTTLTAISEIRSNSLIGTTLKTYTFTTPSNARYLAIYTKAASDSFQNRLRIYSTNPITYNVPITPEQFSGTSATAKIQAAVNFARFTSSAVELKGEYDLDSAVILSSGTTIIMKDAKLLNKFSMKDNTFRNEAVAHPLTHIFNRGNRNIKIIGIGNSILQGSTNGYDVTDVITELWKIHLLHFANVEKFEISGLKILAPRTWALVFVQSRIGTIKNINFEMGIGNLNQDGLHFEHGCHGITVDDIRGNTTDDMIAINNIRVNDNQLILTSNYEPYRTNLDIYDFSIRNIQRSTAQAQLAGPTATWSSLRIITGDSLKVHDISIDGVYGIPEIQIQSTSSSYFTVAPTVNDVYNIHVKDAFCPVYIYRAIKNSTFINVPPFDSTGAFATVKPPSGSLNILRKYQNNQQEFIDSVVSSVEYISVKTPVLVGSGTANAVVNIQGNNAASGNTGTSPNINFKVGNTASTTAMTILNNGNVGIGTTTPGHSLEVNTTAVNSGVRLRATTTGNPVINGVIDGVVQGYMGWVRNANELLTGSAAGDFVVRSDVANLDFGNSSTGVDWRLNTSGHFVPLTNNAVDLGTASLGVRTGFFSTSLFTPLITAPTNLTFKTNNGSTTAMTALSGGNVGIGTAAPASLLNVNGNVLINTVSSTIAAAGGSLIVHTGTDANIAFNNSGGVARLSVFDDAVSSSQPFLFNSLSTRFTISAVEKMRLESTGDLLIGTTTDNSKLTVNGSFATAITSTATSLTATIAHYTILVTATGQTITLPTAVGITGRIYTIKLTSTGSATVATTSSQTIDGSTTFSLSAQYKYVTVQSDNVGWNIIANN